jgi:penicillin-binding protein 1B
MDALRKVDAMSERPLWAESGSIASAPVKIWPGMVISPQEVAQILQAAGYSRTVSATVAGEFQVAESRIRLLRPAAEGAGWSLTEREVEIGFGGGRVTAVRPGAFVSFAPAELAGVRGSDAESRRAVTRETIPAHLVQAVLAMEDARFYEHRGVDPIGILRAIGVNLRSGGKSQGGSTLTQQLAKNLFLTQERTLERKLREAALAFALEQRMTKDELLTLYLNQIYLGQVGGVAICGVDQAARVYFGQSAERIGLGQAASLAGIISAPNRYSPLKHPERAKERRNLVLGRMAKLGWIPRETAAKAKAQPLGAVAPVRHRRAPWAVDAAIRQVEKRLGKGIIASQAVTVGTTIQPVLQLIAERAVKTSLRRLTEHFPKTEGAQMALVAVRAADGAIVAMVGGGNYGASGFNRAMDARRQVGSTVKGLTWLIAYEDDPSMAPSTPIPDQPYEVQVGDEIWAPKNYDGEYLGVVSMQDALAQSRNVPAVLLAKRVGLARIQRGLRGLGLSRATRYPSVALGAFDATPVELAGAFTAFPGRGQAMRPRLVRSVRLPNGREGWAPAGPPPEAMSERAAFLATVSLVRVMTHGTGRRATKFGLTGVVGGKSGTTNDAHDAWFVGFTDTLSVAVWVGFDKGKNLGLTGSQAALPAWTRFVSASGTVGDGFDPPEGVVSVSMCDESGGVAIELCPEQSAAWFSTEAAPREPCPTHGELTEGEIARQKALDGVRENLGRAKGGKARGGFFRRLLGGD